MLLIGLTAIRPKVISLLVIKQIKNRFITKLNRNPYNYHIFRVMDEIIEEINSNHLKIITKIRDLEKKIQSKEASNKLKSDKNVITEEVIRKEKQRLVDENNELKVEVQRLIAVLNQLEAKRDPNSTQIVSTENPVINGSVTSEASVEAPTPSKEEPKAVEKTEKKSAKKEPKPKPNKVSAEEEKPLDVSRLDLRVGRIIEAKRHPDVDSLYVEQIDCGEEKPRTVVSGLVKFVPLEEMQNRLVVVLCNLKAAKMRGILSEAMVMCASSPEAVEILAPPEGSQPGDRVVFDKYPGKRLFFLFLFSSLSFFRSKGTPDSQLNPKKKIWEQIAPDLKTDSDCVATYKGEPFKIETKGVVRAKSLANVAVK